METCATSEWISRELGRRWFPMVWGMPHNTTNTGFVRPDAWIAKNCPDGFKTPGAAHRAARQYLGIEEEAAT